MRTKLLLHLKHNYSLLQLGKLTFVFFLLKGILWLGVTGWFIYLGTGVG